MRFCLEFDLEQNEIPLDYRSCLLSFFKYAFKNYDEEVYENLYSKRYLTKKPFTFSVFLGKAEFGYKDILLENNKIKLNFSTSHYEYGIYFYNAMLKMKFISYPFGGINKIILKSLNFIKEIVINKNEIIAKTLSPIIIRKHDKEKNFDFYYDFHDDDSIKVLKENIINSGQVFFDFDLQFDVEKLEIIPMKLKKIQILYHDHKFIGSIGILELKGKDYLLDYLVKAGIGARRSQGFGMLEIKEVRN